MRVCDNIGIGIRIVGGGEPSIIALIYGSPLLVQLIKS